jgi:hypothetical protein
MRIRAAAGALPLHPVAGRNAVGCSSFRLGCMPWHCLTTTCLRLPGIGADARAPTNYSKAAKRHMWSAADEQQGQRCESWSFAPDIYLHSISRTCEECAPCRR